MRYQSVEARLWRPGYGGKAIEAVEARLERPYRGDWTAETGL